MIILDTNVISEAGREQPSEAVLAWLDSQNGDTLFTTAITEAEIFAGIQIMPDGRKRTATAAAAERLFGEIMQGKILSFDSDAARALAEIAPQYHRRGKTLIEADLQIAAIARVHGAAIATRNVKDFADCGVGVINPWTA